MPEASPRHHAALITAVAAAIVLLVAALVGAGPQIDLMMASLPHVESSSTAAVAIALASAAAVAIVLLRRLVARGAARRRSRALAESLGGITHDAIRTGPLLHALEQFDPEGARPRLDARYSVRVDDHGVSLWSGGRRPRRVAAFAWREVRGIRCDRVAVGASSVPIVAFRVRRRGSSIELPVMLAGDRVTRFALPDDSFYSTVRVWKAQHRTALAAEGLELPPLTSPLPIITPQLLAAYAA